MPERLPLPAFQGPSTSYSCPDTNELGLKTAQKASTQAREGSEGGPEGAVMVGRGEVPVVKVWLPGLRRDLAWSGTASVGLIFSYNLLRKP